MDVTVYLPLYLGVALAAVAPLIARILPPRTGVWCLTAAAITAAASWAAALFMIAFTGLGRIPFVADEGHWSAARWRGLDPVSIWTARVAGTVLTGCAVYFAVTLVREVSARRQVRALSGAFVTDDTLVIVDDDQPHAYAVGGRRPRIVISRGLLRGMSTQERRAVLSHETAHVRHRHDLHLLALRLTAAMNPMLRPAVSAGVLTVERWADEETASTLGDRTLVARTLVRAALVGAASSSGPRVALGHASSDVCRRVTALMAAPPRPRWSVTVATTLLLVATFASPFVAASNLNRLFDRAGQSSVHLTDVRVR